MIVESGSDVSGDEFWAGFDELLNPDDVMREPGPEWKSFAELATQCAHGPAWLARRLKDLEAEGKVERASGRHGGRVKTLYRVK